MKWKVDSVFLASSICLLFAQPTFAQEVSLEKRMFGEAPAATEIPPTPSVKPPVPLMEEEDQFLVDNWIGLVAEKWFFESMYVAASVNSFLIRDVPRYVDESLEDNTLGNVAVGATELASGAVAVAADATLISFLAWYVTDTVPTTVGPVDTAGIYGDGFGEVDEEAQRQARRNSGRFRRWRPVHDSHRLLDFMAGRVSRGVESVFGLGEARRAARQYAELQTYAADIEENRRLIAAADETHQARSNELSEIDETIERHNARLNSIDDELGVLETRLDQVEEDIKRLENDPETVSNHEKQQNLERAREQRTALTDNISQLNSERTNLTTEVEGLHQRRSNVQTAIENLTTERASYEQRIRDFENLRERAAYTAHPPHSPRGPSVGNAIYRWVLRPIGTGIIVAGGGLAALGLANGAFNEPVAIFTGYDQGTLLTELEQHIQEVDSEIKAIWDMGLDPDAARTALAQLP